MKLKSVVALMRLFLICITLFFVPLAYSYDRHYSKEDKRVFFVSPTNKETATSPITIKFGIKGMNIIPAGVDKPMSGHHHLLINIEKLPDMKMPIPADKNHLHFGKGQTETVIDLPKGKHSLQLLLGNYMHVPHEEPFFSEKIEIFVE